MKILLVTTTDKLAEKLAVLNPELEYCALVVDNVEAAKKLLADDDLSQAPIYPIDELKDCVKKINYDYVLRVQDQFYNEKIIMELPKYGVPNDKVVSFGFLTTNHNFKTEQTLRYFKEHASEYEMFATGISPAFNGIDVTQFKRPLFNFAKPSQDLYYDFQVAKHIVLCGGGMGQFVMLSSDLPRILSITISRKFFVTDVCFFLTSLLLTICIIFSCPLISTKNFCAKNGWLKNFR